jgi:N-methylhydantoinase A/oxoprolinase/acetone carboxylase beta subunit
LRKFLSAILIFVTKVHLGRAKKLINIKNSVIIRLPETGGIQMTRLTGELSMKKIIVKASIIALALGALGGCATTDEIAQIRSTAEKALSTANSATSRADNALSAANQALDAANAAQSAADAAATCCSENTSRTNKMFEKAMQK